MDSFSFTALTAGVTLAATTQGLTGFGFSVVAVPLLLTTVDGPTTIVVSLLLSLVLTATLLRRGDLAFARSAAPMFASGIAGAVLGGAALPWLDGPWLRPLVGFLAFGSALMVLVGRFRKQREDRPRSGAGMWIGGFVSGVMNSLASLSGPAAALTTLREGWPPERMRRTLLAYSFFVNAVALCALAPSGLVTQKRIVLSAMLLPAVAVGRWAGTAGARKIPARHVPAIMLTLVLLAGMLSVGEGIAAGMAR